MGILWYIFPISKRSRHGRVTCYVPKDSSQWHIVCPSSWIGITFPPYNSNPILAFCCDTDAETHGDRHKNMQLKELEL